MAKLYSNLVFLLYLFFNFIESDYFCLRRRSIRDAVLMLTPISLNFCGFQISRSTMHSYRTECLKLNLCVNLYIINVFSLFFGIEERATKLKKVGIKQRKKVWLTKLPIHHKLALFCCWSINYILIRRVKIKLNRI